MVSPAGNITNFEDVLSPAERDQYRRRVREIIAESALMANIRGRRGIKPTLGRVLGQIHAQMEMLRIRTAAEMRTLRDPADRKMVQAWIRYLDGALRRSAKTLGLK